MTMISQPGAHLKKECRMCGVKIISNENICLSCKQKEQENLKNKYAPSHMIAQEEKNNVPSSYSYGSSNDIMSFKDYSLISQFTYNVICVIRAMIINNNDIIYVNWNRSYYAWYKFLFRICWNYYCYFIIFIHVTPPSIAFAPYCWLLHLFQIILISNYSKALI